MLTKEQLSSFASNWANKPRGQVAEEIASLSMETKRIPDHYHFIVDQDGKLVSPQTGLPVEASIEENTYLGKIEKQAFLNIQNWVGKNEPGFAIWISPPFPGRYEVSKAIVSELGNLAAGTKILSNRALLLDKTGKECVALANKLAGVEIYQQPEEVRRHPIFLKGELDWSVFSDRRQVEIIETGIDLKEKKRAVEWGYILAENLSLVNQQDEFFGPYGVSCPARTRGTAFDVFLSHSSPIAVNREWKRGVCQKCKKSKSIGTCGICSDCENYCEESE